jgi:hypothetical protein
MNTWALIATLLWLVIALKDWTYKPNSTSNHAVNAVGFAVSLIAFAASAA